MKFTGSAAYIYSPVTDEGGLILTDETGLPVLADVPSLTFIGMGAVVFDETVYSETLEVMTDENLNVLTTP